MAAEALPELHPDLAPAAFLLGHWHGNGHGDYPSIDAFHFRQRLSFTHDGRAFLHYLSRTWLTDESGEDIRPAALETGFLRLRAGGDVEALLAHATGVAEVYYGRAKGGRLEMSTDAVVRTTSAKEYVAGRRLYGLVDGELMWAFDMAAMGSGLQPHIWARLQRD